MAAGYFQLDLTGVSLTNEQMTAEIHEVAHPELYKILEGIFTSSSEIPIHACNLHFKDTVTGNYYFNLSLAKYGSESSSLVGLASFPPKDTSFDLLSVVLENKTDIGEPFTLKGTKITATTSDS